MYGLPCALSSVETSEEEANDGGLIMSVAATSLPSLLDLESTLRLFNLRLWNKLMVILSVSLQQHLRSCYEEVIQLRPLLSTSTALALLLFYP